MAATATATVLPLTTSRATARTWSDHDLLVDLDDALAPHRVPVPPAPLRLVSERRTDQPTRATYLRRRVVAVLVAAVLLVGLAAALGVGGADADGPTPIASTVTIQPGQTLWDVAAAVTPAGGDVRATVDDIVELNGLDGTNVAAWTVIAIPG